jgi:hypothetical protein
VIDGSDGKTPFPKSGGFFRRLAGSGNPCPLPAPRGCAIFRLFATWPGISRRYKVAKEVWRRGL